MTYKTDDYEVPVADAHGHLGKRTVPLGHGVTHCLGDDIVADMDRSGVDHSVVFPLGSPTGDYQESNSLVATEAGRLASRLTGFCRVNPNRGVEAIAAELERCLGKLRLKGIKLHPEIEFFDPNDSDLMEPVYAAAERYKVPLIFHTGMSSKAAPAAVADVARFHPSVPVILGHMGVSEYAKDAVSMAAQHENIFVETSVVGWMPNLLEAFKRLGPGKILYGSDHPYNSFRMEVRKLTCDVREAIDLGERDLLAVMGQNLASILGQ